MSLKLSILVKCPSSGWLTWKIYFCKFSHTMGSTISACHPTSPQATANLARQNLPSHSAEQSTSCAGVFSPLSSCVWGVSHPEHLTQEQFLAQVVLHEWDMMGISAPRYVALPHVTISSDHKFN